MYVYGQLCIGVCVCVYTWASDKGKGEDIHKSWVDMLADQAGHICMPRLAADTQILTSL